MFIQVSSNSFGQRVPHLAKALQRPPNDYQRSDVGQRIDVAQRHGNSSQRISMGQRADDSNLALRPPYVGQRANISQNAQIQVEQRPPNDSQRSKLGQHIDVRQRHGNLSQQQYRLGQRLDVGQRSDVALRTTVTHDINVTNQDRVGQHSIASQRSDVSHSSDLSSNINIGHRSYRGSNANIGQRSNAEHVYDQIDTKQQLFQLCQERIVDTNSSYKYNAATMQMEELNHSSWKNLEDLNKIVLTDDFLTDTDMMLRQMCNLGYNFNSKKSSKTHDDPDCNSAYYESTNDADDDAEDDYDDEDDDESDDDDKDHDRGIFCSEKMDDFVKSQLRKQTNPNLCERSCCQSSLNASNNDQTIKNACYHQTFMNLAVSVH